MNVMQMRVRKFHEVFGHPVAEVPIPVGDLLDKREFEILGNKPNFAMSGDRVLFGRVSFMVEEISEYAQALGAHDTVGCADALADLLVFLLGTAIIHGIDLEAVFNEVMDSNMNKTFPCPKCATTVRIESCPDCFGTGRVSKMRADGKILKPNGWTPPDVATVLVQLGARLDNAAPQT